MRTHLLMLVLAALICVPAVGVQAGVGNGQSDVPPGLIRARERTLADIERQIQREEQKFARKMAGLEQQLLEALLIGDPELVDKIEEKIDEETARHEGKMAKLQQKHEEKGEKFLQKMEEFRNRHGEEEEEPPPPPEPEGPIVH